MKFIFTVPLLKELYIQRGDLHKNYSISVSQPISEQLLPGANTTLPTKPSTIVLTKRKQLENNETNQDVFTIDYKTIGTAKTQILSLSLMGGLHGNFPEENLNIHESWTTLQNLILPIIDQKTIESSVNFNSIFHTSSDNGTSIDFYVYLNKLRERIVELKAEHLESEETLTHTVFMCDPDSTSCGESVTTRNNNDLVIDGNHLFLRQIAENHAHCVIRETIVVGYTPSGIDTKFTVPFIKEIVRDLLMLKKSVLIVPSTEVIKQRLNEVNDYLIERTISGKVRVLGSIIISKEFDVKYLGWNNNNFEQSEWIELLNTDNTDDCGVKFEVETPPVTNIDMAHGTSPQDIPLSSETENAAGSDANKTQEYTSVDVSINDFFYSIIDKNVPPSTMFVEDKDKNRFRVKKSKPKKKKGADEDDENMYRTYTFSEEAAAQSD